MQIAGQTAELPEIRRRARWLAVFFVLMFSVLCARLFYLQVIEGDGYYRTTSDSIIRTRVLPALRGEIRDRYGKVLATTRPSYNVVLVPEKMNQTRYENLSRLLNQHEKGQVPSWEEFLEITKKHRDQAYTLAEDVSRVVMATLETSMDGRGVEIVAEPRRVYPRGNMAGHLLGYLNEVSGDELQTLKAEGYRSGDKIGRTGIEKQWEPYLRGRKGQEKYLVERKGVRQSEIQIADLVEGPIKVPPVPGENLILTLDSDLQRIAERSLRVHRTGALVVLDIETGRILASASTPGFDSNQMSGRLTVEAATRMFTDPFRPFRDRTMNETYGPGSTFKVVTALAALEDGIITPEDRTKCNGFVQIGQRRFKCTKTHGVVDLHHALVQSCNVYFYELGMRPGMMNRIARFATELGLGAPTGLGLNGEQPGFIPTEEWHRQRDASPSTGRGFMIGHALNTAIGEGATRVTATQMALLYAAIAKDGVLWLPQIIDRIESNDGTVLEQFPPRVRRHVSISENSLSVIKKALAGVVADNKGTAHKVFSKELSFVGKTGTTQVRTRANPRTGEVPPPHERLDHAWFAGFSPRENPEVAFAVIIEHGGHGGDVAAPVAANVLSGYWSLKAARAENDNGENKPTTQPTARKAADRR